MIGLTFTCHFHDSFSASNPPLVDAPQPREEPPPPAVEQMEKELIGSEENTDSNAEHITFQLPVVVSVHSEPNGSVSIQPSTQYDKLETINL